MQHLSGSWRDSFPATGYGKINSFTKTNIMRLLVGTSFLLIFSRPAPAQTPSNQTTQAAVTRPCAATPASAKPAKSSKPSGKGKAVDVAEVPAVCLEVQGESLDIQEFLQKMVRELKWKTGEGQATEDAWTFVRYLERADLERFAKTDAVGGQVAWTEGKAVVQVRTVEARDAFTRVEISAGFQGYGRSADRFAPPKDTWTLLSTGALENDMMNALKTRFQPAR
jgi:hypothetical protein